jgi:hypothetical protein
MASTKTIAAQPGMHKGAAALLWGEPPHEA